MHIRTMGTEKIAMHEMSYPAPAGGILFNMQSKEVCSELQSAEGQEAVECVAE